MEPLEWHGCPSAGELSISADLPAKLVFIRSPRVGWDGLGSVGSGDPGRGASGLGWAWYGLACPPARLRCVSAIYQWVSLWVIWVSGSPVWLLEYQRRCVLDSLGDRSRSRH